MKRVYIQPELVTVTSKAITVIMTSGNSGSVSGSVGGGEGGPTYGGVDNGEHEADAKKNNLWDENV